MSTKIFIGCKHYKKHNIDFKNKKIYIYTKKKSGKEYIIDYKAIGSISCMIDSTSNIEFELNNGDIRYENPNLQCLRTNNSNIILLQESVIFLH